MKPAFTIGVFAIIFDSEKRVLLCHRRDRDLWNLPGGGLEPGESPWEGVIREVKEETGFDVKVDTLLGVYSKPDKREVVFSFLCNIVGGESTLTEESDQIEYFTFENIPENTSKKQIERIQDVINDDSVVYLKNQLSS